MVALQVPRLRPRRYGLTLVSLVGLMLASAAAGPSALAANPQPGDPLPACDYQDVMTRYRAYNDWRKTLVDTIERVGKYYVPPDLVATSKASISGGGQVRAAMIDDLRAMAAVARDAGNPLAVASAYRSYAQQRRSFHYWVRVHGRKRGLLESARPGHSEHQLGLAIDFTAEGDPIAPWDHHDWATTPSGAWMKLHAWEYGYVMSYPKYRTHVTCYEYEPWHYRYVGRTEAAAVHDSGMVLRRYLWRNFETAPSG
jgi:D-alanyl-D-alanine carboxypeptidase